MNRKYAYFSVAVWLPTAIVISAILGLWLAAPLKKIFGLDPSGFHDFTYGSSVLAAVAVGLFIAAIFIQIKFMDKVVQLEWLRSRKKIIDQDSLINQIKESVFDGIITIDNDGVIVSSNSTAENLFGYTTNELLGKNIRHLIAEPGQSPNATYVLDFFRTGTKDVVGHANRMIGTRNDGTTLPIELIAWEADVDGNVLFNGFIRDLSCQVMAEENLLARRQAESENMAKSAFLSQMSHELRTPLNAILGYSEFMLIDPGDPPSPTQVERINHVIESGQHLLTLISDILDLAKIESGQLPLQIENLDPKDLIEEVVTQIRIMAEKRKINIVNLAGNCKPCRIRGDKIRFQQVLLNLLSNAVKYSPENSSVNIEMAITADNMIRIKVVDSGPGIPADQRYEIFRPFTRLNAGDDNIEGTGIGLAIAKQLVESMQGRIDFESLAGLGSTFWFDLPHAPAQIEIHADEGESDRSDVQTLVYVDSKEENIRLMAEFLRHIPSLELRSASDVETGLELVNSSSPDIILIDLDLAETSDGATMRKIWELGADMNIPIIAVGKNCPENGALSRRNPAFFEYFETPVSVHIILQSVKDALDQHHARPSR